MCTNIPVNLPTVQSFLLLYSLRCGCIVILSYTMIRALFYVIFFMVTMVEVFLPASPPMAAYSQRPPPPDDHYFFAFFAYIFIIVAESFLLVYSVYLGMGLYYESSSRLKQYLICRFCTWLVEVVILVMLCFIHITIIGWYLVFLMIIILEFYAFIVVYSYYVDMKTNYYKDYHQTCDPRICETRSDPRLGDPRVGDPRMGDPRVGDPRFCDLRLIDPRPLCERPCEPRAPCDPRPPCDPRLCDPRFGDPRLADQRTGCAGFPVGSWD